VIWDRKKTIVNNDSWEITKILYSSFDALLSWEMREVNKLGGRLRPEHSELVEQIDILNMEIHVDFNWGAYKCGFASSRENYDESMRALFGRLDEIEKRLDQSKYLLRDHITELDILQDLLYDFLFAEFF
jgi:putative glutathione S-transferase